MSRNRWVEAAQAENQAQTAVANTTTESKLASSFPMSKWFLNLDRNLRVHAIGQFSTTGTPTLTFRFRVGSADANTDAAVCASAAITTATGASNLIWEVEADISVRSFTYGATAANVMGIGKVTVTDAATNTKVPQYMPASAPAVSAGYNYESNPNFLGLYVTWSVASASNTITTHIYTVEVLT